MNENVSLASGDRVSEVLARLSRVNDPELDESVTELRFITGVAVDEAGRVSVGFRLPTYWCAANFAFLMADDMRQEIATLPWVTSIRIELGEHMYAETINNAVAAGRSFRDAFAEEADGNLDEVRRIFALKAFQRRQLALLEHLTALHYVVGDLLALRIGDLAGLDVADQGRALIERYLQRRDIPGPAGPAELAFVDENGRPVSIDTYAAHRRALRRVTVNVEFNGALCRGLLAARFDEADPSLPAEPADHAVPAEPADHAAPAEPADHAVPREPTLLDFVRGHRPEAVRTS